MTSIKTAASPSSLALNGWCRWLVAAAALTVAGALMVGEAAAQDFRGIDTTIELPPEQISSILSAQDKLLADALGQLAPQRPGVRDIYVVTLAGHAGQTAFRKEAIKVREVLERQLGTPGHAITLANSVETTTIYPLASPENIERVLVGVGKVLDPKEDVLLMYMTSHGEPDRFTLRFNGFPMHDLSSRDLVKMFKSANIGPRAVFMSACYSGSFIKKLEGPDALVATASSADRVAYGDLGLKEHTFFGEAIFSEAFPSSRSLTKAFDIARTQIDSWEKQYDLEPSYPQISVGSNIATVLIEMGLGEARTIGVADGAGISEPLAK